MGEKVITPSSLVQLVVKARFVPPGYSNVPQVDPAELEDLLASGARLRVVPVPDLQSGGRDPALYEQQNHENLRDEVARQALGRGEVLATLELFPAVGENPSLSLEVEGQEETRLWLRDNNGNEFEAAL